MPGMLPFAAKKKSLPQADKSAKRGRVPKTGPDDNAKTKQAGRETTPKLPERDGPAKDAVGGKMAGKPKTSARIQSMKESLKKV